ncbi:MAG TPA: PQQ-binding-like beta-propeller repeat protein, partial [Kofleriaceae bacterium]
MTEEIGGPIRGIASDGSHVYVARDRGTGADIEAEKAWHLATGGTPGPLIASDGQVTATVSGHGAIADLGAPVLLHGEPSSVVVAIDPATGKVRWRLPFDSPEFAVITSIAPIVDGVKGSAGIVVGGTFSGTLRVGDAVTHTANARDVVASAGRSDGFVALLGTDGSLKW